jgi:ribosomal protection tetracycline resistance protein
MKFLNLGILAHVDAGKTSLTERLLYNQGVIATLGSVDQGNTTTDSMALERQRGITIKTAVASFVVDDVTVNLIDTPGHPDFIAEVERSLSVLDGAVLVVSAVEGVQPQTRVLMRTLLRLHIPTLLFVNKMDRTGADAERVLQEIATRLAPETGFLGASWRQAVFYGSAITGAGVPELLAGITRLLPASAGLADEPAAGRVFKIERGSAGEKIAYVRMLAGSIGTRQSLALAPDRSGKVTAIKTFEQGRLVTRARLAAGEIGKVWGLAAARVGDPIGTAPALDSQWFARPTLQTVVEPAAGTSRSAVHAALTQLAEQDPLINLRQDDAQQELCLSLYGEVQKEVIQDTLAADYGLHVTFKTTTVVCIERLAGTGEAVELLQSDDHPYTATIGLRLEPAAPGSGLEFRLNVEPRYVPLYIYKTRGAFVAAMTEYVRGALEHGLAGWPVTDCVVTMYACNYYVGDGPSKPTLPTPATTAADFRKLTPMVMQQALRRAGTVVCQPMTRVRLELPAAALAPVLALLGQLGARPEAPAAAGEAMVVEAVLAAHLLHRLQQRLPGLTGGEGVLEPSFGGYEPVLGR